MVATLSLPLFQSLPQRLSFSFTNSFPNIQLPKTISGTFLLFSIYDRGFHLFILPKKKLVAYLVGTLIVTFGAAFLFFYSSSIIFSIPSNKNIDLGTKRETLHARKKLMKKRLTLQAIPLATICDVVEKSFSLRDATLDLLENRYLRRCVRIYKVVILDYFFSKKMLPLLYFNFLLSVLSSVFYISVYPTGQP
jgi:hypothetical protein